MIQRRNGTIKNNRQGKNLLDSQFKMDQRPFWEILGYITSFLERVNYYNLQNQQEGNWKVLIEGDPIIYMTMIINHPTKDIEELIALYEDGALDESVLEKGVEVLVDWYNRIDGWQYQLLYMGEKKLSQKIKNIVVDVLLPEKNKLTNYKESQGQHKSKDQDEQSLDLRIMPIPSPSEEVQPKKILNTFHRIIIHIKEFVKEYLQQHIYDDNQHRPNNAMYIAFVLLFKKVQEQLNEFSQKHWLCCF